MSIEEEIIAMYKEGFGADRISDALDVEVWKVYHTLRKHNIPRRPSGSYDYTREWRTLKRITKGKRMRSVTIPVRLIKEAGFDPDEELMGNWRVERKRLVLRIKQVGLPRSVSSKLKRKLLGGGRK